MKLNIVSKELIKPSIPTPPENVGYNLSFLDEPTPHFYIPLVLYYHNHNHANQSEILSRLKSSLSKTLTKFYPLAGRNKGQTLVNCSDEGVCFVVARGEGMIQEMIGSPEGKESEKLVPYGKAAGNTIVAKTEELLGVQVSLFRCGGVAIGVCISHRVADVCSLCAFLKGWAACACGDEIKVSPVFNGSSLFPARGTPDFKPPEGCSALQPPPEPLATKRFVFSASAIDEMKSKHMKTNTAPASRVEVVSALLWKRCTAAKEPKPGATVSANTFPVNLRRRMAPPLPEYSFGNLYQTASAVADGEEDWPGLVTKIRAASERIDSGYVTRLRGENGFQVLKENFREIGRLMGERDVVVLRFTSWCGFPVYEMDFGWGNPGWVSTPGFGSIDTVILLDSRWPGGVEAWVTMADEDMSRLEQDKELHSFTC